ncbi:hypothetical protein [Pelagibius sp. Alg239-R121]|uniref:hypothetical protein n=1 Tax=Pelagibius sp. Alg239-R121 TaxID=2993448 RepID=UPI0024A75EA2|nr:hypothetical protein [Pelagibius sp. Alg239-R121]
MAKLSSADILGEIETKDPPKEPKSQDATKAKKREVAKTVGAFKPSAYESDLRAKLRDKVQCNIGSIPRFINDELERLVAESGMGKKEYFYQLLREKGADIPPYENLDGRKL